MATLYFCFPFPNNFFPSFDFFRKVGHFVFSKPPPLLDVIYFKINNGKYYHKTFRKKKKKYLLNFSLVYYYFFSNAGDFGLVVRIPHTGRWIDTIRRMRPNDESLVCAKIVGR
uniref:Uncharacterized protein n=1 Tax=Cacopsylla melanoneura TaxID=428564 RepID=A0A8D8USM3_9HEMI